MNKGTKEFILSCVSGVLTMWLLMPYVKLEGMKLYVVFLLTLMLISFVNVKYFFPMIKGVKHGRFY